MDDQTNASPRQFALNDGALGFLVGLATFLITFATGLWLNRNSHDGQAGMGGALLGLVLAPAVGFAAVTVREVLTDAAAVKPPAPEAPKHREP